MFQAGQWSRTYEIFVGGREEEEGRRVRRLMDGACDSLGTEAVGMEAVTACMGAE